MHTVIRRYTGATALITALEQQAHDVERIMGTVPGFVAYHAVRADDTLVTVTIGRDRAATDESTRRAAQWVREHLPAGAVGAPEITEGEAFLDFAAPQTLGAGGVRA